MSDKIQSNNFINIQGWMVKDLELKNNELLVFAIIYGFSQDGSSYFSGSSSYLAEWCNCDKRNIFNILKKLIKKNLIIKKEKIVNGVKLVDYSVNHEITHDVKKVHGGSEIISVGVVKKVHGGSEKSSYHNIEDNILDNIEDNIIGDELSNNFQNTNTNDNSLSLPSKEKKFVEPSIEDIENYVQEKSLCIDPLSFFNYYSALGWHDTNNKKIKNWKLKAIMWDAKQKEKNLAIKKQQEQDSIREIKLIMGDLYDDKYIK